MAIVLPQKLEWPGFVMNSKLVWWSHYAVAGKKVMMWWLRAEACADSKFPARWRIDPPLEVTVAAKRTPWPDPPLELESNTEKLITATGIHENSQKNPPKTRTPRSRRIKGKDIGALHNIEGGIDGGRLMLSAFGLKNVKGAVVDSSEIIALK
ncbi:hypothetical protein L2E82_28107 [Cichorium intybus]|uniref:Uncharacterized protein n=1 Tax=Cichorium intybus TaxID=13427 RepID=A0ACB9CUT2_CICIN|nr:hypothetical protein L2E82_28107 [Cichorium intybus]